MTPKRRSRLLIMFVTRIPFFDTSELLRWNISKEQVVRKAKDTQGPPAKPPAIPSP